MYCGQGSFSTNRDLNSGSMWGLDARGTVRNMMPNRKDDRLEASQWAGV